MAHIVVINPNASLAMTQSIERSVASLSTKSGHRFSFETNRSGPNGIETDADVESVIPAILQKIRGQSADAYVIACFSDPGAETARSVTGQPVIGIAEAAYLTAMAAGRRIGIISLFDSSIARHRRRMEFLGLYRRLAGDRPINVGTADLAGEGVLGRLREVGCRLRDEDGADVVILGCAGLGRYRGELEGTLGMPVIDPIQAAVIQVSALLMLRGG